MDIPEILRARAYGVVPARLRTALLLLPEAPLILLAAAAALLLGPLPVFGWLLGLLAAIVVLRAAALHMGRAALTAGRPQQARWLGSLALALHPWSADALALSGAAALQCQQPESAEQLLRQATQLAPGRAALFAALSGALLELGRNAEAATAARQALQLDPQCAAAYLHLAEAERGTAAPAWAIEERLRSGLRHAADPDVEAALRCALAAHLIGQGRLAEANLATAGVEAALPNCSPAHRARLRLRLCELLLAQGHTDRARAHLSMCAAD
jgi:tetratricopeptide (TPR) repeat protein